MRIQKQLALAALFAVLAFLTPALWLLSCGGESEVSEPQIIPRMVIFGNPERATPRLSPDGTMMSYLAPVDNVLNIWIGTIGKDDARVVTSDTLRGIHRYFWAADSKRIIYLQDKGGDENWRLYSVDLESGEIADLTPYENVTVRIINQDKNFPEELLIAMNKENVQVHDVYHLNLKTGEINIVAKNPGNVMAWHADANFKVRAATMANAEAGFDLMVRQTEQDQWKRLITWNAQDALTSGAYGFTRDGNAIYIVDSRDVNAGRLCKIDVNTGELEVLAEDPQYDVSGVMVHPDTYQIQAAFFTKERNTIVILDESIRDDITAIGQVHDGDFFVSSRSLADDTWLVGFEDDNGPIPYYAYDRATKQATFLFDHRPELRKYTLAEMQPISFTTRDSLVIHGYITYPVGKERKNLPMVLNVHGGPWYRDIWGYNPEVQWLANRGYACLQVNFRGSTGYGKDFVNAGDREWGGKMHHDLIDAVNWAIDMGIADPKKIAIYGGSYGGYAALVGATFTPDVFCCAVDIVGVSNLMTFINSIPPYWSTFLDVLHKRVGSPETDEEFLTERSPLFKADQIKIPMLIAQGANDPRVKQAESEQIVAAMQANNVDYEYLLFEDEGHGFARPENRLKFYAAAEKFLAKHMGGRFEEAPAGQ
ncbi:MAG: S9 family peptidase [Candidatus Zixiibacteriota bacterium]|nr:MAG: S9 family peptidase [candidate division Zixibacteria bacterium]